jgi:hypothetical protein
MQQQGSSKSEGGGRRSGASRAGEGGGEGRPATRRKEAAPEQPELLPPGQVVTTNPDQESAQMDQTTLDAVRAALHAVWGRQACHRPADWPRAFDALMRPNDTARTSLRQRYEAAIVTLADAYRLGPPADGPDRIWRAFAHLDREHRAELHDRLAALNFTLEAA